MMMPPTSLYETKLLESKVRCRQDLAAAGGD
jgi:hypothetical protein